jgi:O-antigen ligase
MIHELHPSFASNIKGRDDIEVSADHRGRIWMLYLFLVVATFTKLLPPLPIFSISIGSLQIWDCLFLYLLVTSVSHWSRSRLGSIFTNPTARCLLWFCIMVVVSAIVSKIALDGDWWLIRREMRRLLYYLFFLVVIIRIQNTSQAHKLAKAVIYIGFFSSLFSVLYGLFDFIPLPWNVNTNSFGYDIQDMQGIERIGFPGGEFVFFGFIMTVCLLIFAGGKINRSRYILMLCIYIIALAISLTRNFWISITLSIAIIFILVKSELKVAMAKYLTTLVCVLLLMLVLLSVSSNRIGSYGSAVMARMSTIFTNELWEEDSTMVDRYEEDRLALEKISQSPIFGIGLGNPYREQWYPKDVGMYYVHNAYLHIWLYLGIGGLLAFLVLSGVFVYRAMTRWKQIQDPVSRAVVLATGTAYVGMLVTNWVAPFFIQASSLVLFPMMMGINEVIYCCSTSDKLQRETEPTQLIM